jgi:hypothetical protein
MISYTLWFLQLLGHFIKYIWLLLYICSNQGNHTWLVFLCQILYFSMSSHLIKWSHMPCKLYRTENLYAKSMFRCLSHTFALAYLNNLQNLFLSFYVFYKKCNIFIYSTQIQRIVPAWTILVIICMLGTSIVHYAASWYKVAWVAQVMSSHFLC